MGAIEKIEEMRDTEIVARDAAMEALKATNDPAVIAAIVVEYGARCAAVGAFMAALEEIEREAAE